MKIEAMAGALAASRMGSAPDWPITRVMSLKK